MTGAGKSVIIADLLAQIGHQFGFRLIVEEGLSHAVLTQTHGCEPVIVNPNGYYAIAKVYERKFFRLRNRSYALSKNSRCPEIVLSEPMWLLGNGLKHRASQPITNGCCHCTWQFDEKQSRVRTVLIRPVNRPFVFNQCSVFRGFDF
jgi:hypothetical protein